MSNGVTPPKILGIFALAMINVAAVLSIRNFPSMAEFGWSCIGWYIIGTV
ncbi:MAG: amino acid permease, partial [Methanoregulaceae archaeon]|nr:amino acid permease [Methanoregulaceae archaeon]